MSDDEVIRLPPELEAMADGLTKSFITVLSGFLGHQMKAVVILAPTTNRVHPEGKTQSQLISNMTPRELKRTLKEVNEQVSEENIEKLQAQHEVMMAQAAFQASGVKAN